MHFGFEPGALLADADLVIAIDADAPWIPSVQHPPAGCRVAHIGEDPFFVRYPMRSFPSDLAIQAGAVNTLDALGRGDRAAAADGGGAHRRAPRPAHRAHAQPARPARQGFDARRDDLAGISVALHRRGGRAGRHHLQRIFAARGASRAREAGHAVRARTGRRPRLGPRRRARRQARRARTRFVVATLGDGAYMFSNPMVGHWVVRQARPADPHHHLQQQPLRRGAQRHAVDVQGRRRRRGRRPLPRRSRSGAALRGDGAWRKAPMASASRSPPNCPMRWRARATPSSTAAQALLNVITPY